MDFTIQGLEEFQQKLEDLSKRAERLDGAHEVPISELLTPSFLSGCSRFVSVNEMFEASGFKVDSQEDFRAVPDAEWDAFIRGNTSFVSWQEMLQAATSFWTKNQLGL